MAVAWEWLARIATTAQTPRRLARRVGLSPSLNARTRGCRGDQERHVGRCLQRRHMDQLSRLASICWLASTLALHIEAVINYVAKYCTGKSESQTNTCAEFSKATLPHASDRNPMRSFVSKMMNRLVGERDYSAQETCHLLLGLRLQEHSRVVRPRSTNTPLNF